MERNRGRKPATTRHCHIMRETARSHCRTVESNLRRMHFITLRQRNHRTHRQHANG